MGVPGFFMWLWKNYKKKNFVFKKNESVNNIDYFLIDTNCLIHPKCFEILDLHNKDYGGDTNKQRLENKMMNHVLEYLEHIVSFVNPKKGFYIAIDGVAPVAKIKQQRSRRFKSVHDKTLNDNIKRKHGKEIKYYWNNSAITPGTDYMIELNNKIINWCKNYKKKNKNIQIIYSSCNTPQEGEHKLMNFIRDNIKNNYKYVIYGLDADLLFLGLAANIPNVYLLREDVHLNFNQRTNDLSYVSLDVMRDAISISMEKIINGKFKFNLDRIINDFVFICYLLGNDFLPHLPSLDIGNRGLDNLLEIYAEYLVQTTKYIIDYKKKDKINHNNFKLFINKLALQEDKILSKGKKKFNKRINSSDPYDIEMNKIETLSFKIDDPIKLGKDDYEKYRFRYYNHYFGVEESDIEEFVEDMVKNYCLGLKWVTNYYFEGLSSWDWYYPYDYPPFLSDIAKYIDKIKFKDFKFKIGKPLKPFVQLLCVLPPQSSFLLPNKINKIMTNPNSSCAMLYPIDFKQDFIGKDRYWKAIPKLPNLEIELVKRTFKKYEKVLTTLDKKKNRTVKNYVF